MTEDETRELERELERELWLAHAAMEAFADALPGLDPATLEDLASGGHDAVEAARAADPLWRLYLWFTEAWEAVGDAAEDVRNARPDVIEAARALVRVARNGTAAVAATPSPPTVALRRDVYVRLRHFAGVGETRDLGDGVHVDLGDDGEVLGVEVLDAVDLTINGVTLPGVNPLQVQLEASERLRAGLRMRLAEAQRRVVVRHDRAVALSDLLRGMARRAGAQRRAAVTLAREHAATDQAMLGTFRELRDCLEGLRQGLLAALNVRESALDSLTLLRNLVDQRDALRATEGTLRGQLGDALARLEEATLKLADAEQEGSDALLTREAMGHDLVQARLERDAALTQRDNLDADRRTLWEKCERLQAMNDELAPLAIVGQELTERLRAAQDEVSELRASCRDDARDQALTEGATEDQLAQLEERVAALLQDNRTLTHRNSSLKDDNGELADQVTSLGETCEDLEQDVLRLQGHAGSLNATLDRVRAVLDRHDPCGHLPAVDVSRRVAAALDTYAWLLAERTWQRDDAMRRRRGAGWNRDETNVAETTVPSSLVAPTEGRHVSDVLISQHGELTELRARVAALEAAADSCAECGYRGGRHHYWCAAIGDVPGVTTAQRSAWRKGERA